MVTEEQKQKAKDIIELALIMQELIKLKML